MSENRRSTDIRTRRGLDRPPITIPFSGNSGPNPRQINTTRSDTEDIAFYRARRALRIWPIEGSTPEEMRNKFEDFCWNALLLAEDMDIGIESVERVRSAPRGVAHMEILVVFTDNYSRDRIFSCGPKLASYRDAANKPTCGIRLHIPGHLMSHFKTLESFAGMLREKHGSQMKKHIKFDEHKRSLFIQIKHEDDKEWVDFGVEQAREEKERMNQRRVVRSHLFNSSLVAQDSQLMRTIDKPQPPAAGTFVPAKRKRQATGTNKDGQPAASAATQSWRPPVIDDNMY